MKYNLQTFGITSQEEYRCARGVMIGTGSYKGVKLSETDIAVLDEQVLGKGWTLKTSNAESEVTPYDQLTDVEFASKFVSKANSSSKRGIKFELTFAQYRRLLLRKKCYFSGEKLTYGQGRNHFTLDRIDSSIGYTKENTVPCATWVNELKNSVLENNNSRIKTDIKTLKKIIGKL